MAAAMAMKILLMMMIVLLAMIQIETFATERSSSSSETQDLMLSVRMIKKCASTANAIAVLIKKKDAENVRGLLRVERSLLRY